MQNCSVRQNIIVRDSPEDALAKPMSETQNTWFVRFFLNTYLPQNFEKSRFFDGGHVENRSKIGIVILNS